MSGKFLFGEWRFVGRMMRKKGLLLLVVLLLQAGLLGSLAVVLSLTNVKDTINGKATVRLDGRTVHASFSADNLEAAALKGVPKAVLVIALPEHPDGLSLPVEVVRVEAESVLLRSSEPDVPHEILQRGGTGTDVDARLVFRKRTLLSAMVQDRKQGKKRGAGFLSGF